MFSNALLSMGEFSGHLCVTTVKISTGNGAIVLLLAMNIFVYVLVIYWERDIQPVFVMEGLCVCPLIG